MASEFKLPELGEGVETGTVSKLLVGKGDSVSEGQPILEMETDKAVAEIPANFSGTVLELKVKEGQGIKVGQTILTFEAGKAKAEEKPAPAKEEAVKAQAPVEQAKAQVAQSVAPATKPASGETRPVTASPSIRRYAREQGVDLKEVPASDPSGRLTAQDIDAYLGGGSEAPAQTVTAPAKADISQVVSPPKSDLPSVDTKWGPVVNEPWSAVRRKTVQHMTHCWTTIPHVTHFDKADITSLEELRAKYGKKVEAKGGKLTTLSFILKLLPEALKRFPKFNASIDLENESLILKQYFHIGVAVDTPSGLLVPVIRDCDQKSIVDISVELPQLAQKARDRKLALDDMQGGCLTVTNLGGLGGSGFTPIINAPEVAILGLSRTQIEPVWQNGQFGPRAMLPLSLSYDHRVIDGADAARFTRWVAEALEQPWHLFLD